MEEPSFLISNTRLAVAKMSPSQNLTQNSRWRNTNHRWRDLKCSYLPKHRSSVNLIQRTRAPIRTLTVFQALFAGPRSSLNIIFELITNKAKRVKLLILCRVFSQRSEEDFKPRMLESFAGCSPRWPTPMFWASIFSSSLTPLHRVFICVVHVFPLLIQLWDALRILRHQDDSRTRYACPPSAQF